MTWIMVDVESDGPVPGLYSMTEVGAVAIREDREVAAMPAFYGRFAPISGDYMQEALAVCGRTREETLSWPDAATTVREFEAWLQKHTEGRPIFVSDNNGFDYQFVAYYFWRFLQRNPFGHSSQNLGSLYKGLVKDTFKNFKHLRKTKHSHHPVDDCRGNVEALLHMKQEMGLGIRLG